MFMIFQKKILCQSDCPEWFKMRENRITSSKAHSEFNDNDILNPKETEELPKIVQETFLANYKS